MRTIIAALALIGGLHLTNVVKTAAVTTTPPKDCLTGCLLAQALVNTWQNESPTGNSDRVQLINGGEYVAARCYVHGQDVNGDDIWYWSRHASKWGYVAGYYLATGHDPATIHC